MTIHQSERISRALSDIHRLRILQTLPQKNNVLLHSELADLVKLSQPAISHHMKLLTNAGLLIAQKRGRTISYRLDYLVLNSYMAFLDSLRGSKFLSSHLL